MLTKVLKIKPLDGFRLQLTFSDGTEGIFDCAPILAESAGPMVQPLKDPAFFSRVFLDYGAPTWPNGYDMAPWAIQEELRKAGVLKRVDDNAA